MHRLARRYYAELKTPISIAAGHTVTLAIATADRAYAAFFFDPASQQRGHQIGPYYSFRVSGGRRASG